MKEQVLKSFSWGRITNIYELPDYLIVAYFDKEEQVIRYHPYINGRDTNHSFTTLDLAIVTAIAFKHDGGNSQAVEFFMKMIKN